MWKWLPRLFSKAETSVNDSWHGYVAEFRRELEIIAEKLSQSEEFRFSVRFNSGWKCAEFHTPEGAVIARVVMVGGRGTPNNVLVTHGPSFKKEWKPEFTSLLPGNIQFLMFIKWSVRNIVKPQ